MQIRPQRAACWVALALALAFPAAPSAQTGPSGTTCRDVKQGSLSWETRRSNSLQPSVARQSAIEEALAELVRQTAGIEIRSYTRTDQTLVNDDLNEEMRAASFAKSRARVISYDLVDMREAQDAGWYVYSIDIQGSVCTDPGQEGPLIIALARSASLPSELRDVISSTLSRRLAREPELSLVDSVGTAAYSDIDVEVELASPEIEKVDRSAAIAAIKSSLGSEAARGIEKFGTRIVVRVTMRAEIADDGVTLVSSEQAERELPGDVEPPASMIREMQSEAGEAASVEFAKSLVKHMSLR